MEKNKITTSEINKILKDYILKGTPSYHNPDLCLKLAYKLLEYANKNFKGSVYGDLYNDGFNKALAKAEAEIDTFLQQPDDSGWFVTLFRHSIDNLEAEKRDRNIGATNYEKQKQASLYLDRIIEKYGIPKTGRPSGDQKNNNILEPGVVKKYLEKIVADNPGKYAITQNEIDDLDRRISALQSYSEGDGNTGEDDQSDISLADRVEDNRYSVEEKDALRFIKCSRLFYKELNNHYSDLDADALAEISILAKDFITLELYKCYPSAFYLNFVKASKVINVEFYDYITKQKVDVNQKGWVDKVYASYLTNVKGKKRAAGTINKELRKVTGPFKNFLEKGLFKPI